MEDPHIMDVGLALRNCPKGQLKYDRYWIEEGRTKEVLDSISKYSSKISVSISPKIFPYIIAEHQENNTISNSYSNDAKSPEKKASPKPNQDITDVHFFENLVEKELPLQEYEQERFRAIQGIFESKKNEFDYHSMEIQEQIVQEYLLSKRKNDLDARRRTAELRKLEETVIKEAQEVENLQKEQYQSHVKKLSAKMLEAEMKQKQAEEELKKKLQEQEELKFQLITCLKEAEGIVNKSTEKLNFCECLDYLNVSRNDRLAQLNDLLKVISTLVYETKDKELTIDDILNANLHVQKACEILQEISADIDCAKTKAARDHATLTFQNQLASNSFQENVTPQNINNEVDKTAAISEDRLNDREDIDVDTSGKVTPVENSEDQEKLASRFIATDAVDQYQVILDNFKRIDSIVLAVRNDPKNKKYRFELQKAINVPINSLSSNSGSEIKVKINRLLSILTGKASETSGRNLNTDSPIFIFCANLIAKQFVEQGDTQISSQHSTAFPIAFAALGVWTKQPEVGKLLLGHFYDKCPYLIPYYPPKEKGQTSAEFFKSLGYRFEDGDTIEPKYKFLNRISGYVRLYAAIIQSPLPPNQNTPHPHGVEWGWKWLSRIMNLEPRPDVTATVLYDFLDVAGYALQKAYGKQFNKMLHILCKDYFKKIKQVTPGGSGGPLERLEIFLQQTAKKGRISPPEGYLDGNFWNR